MVRYGSNPREQINQVLANDASMTRLELAGNPIFQPKADELCVVLSEALKSNSNLVELNLNNCYVTSVGAVAISEALKVCLLLYELTNYCPTVVIQRSGKPVVRASR